MFPSIKMKEYIEFELCGIFLAKNGHQKYSTCVAGDPFED